MQSNTLKQSTLSTSEKQQMTLKNDQKANGLKGFKFHQEFLFFVYSVPQCLNVVPRFKNVKENLKRIFRVLKSVFIGKSTLKNPIRIQCSFFETLEIVF